jgi:hypothetical protein
MREWLINNGVWAIGLIFVGGSLYSQVNANTEQVKKWEARVHKVDLMEAQVTANATALHQLSREAVGQYKEFLGKLDQVIMRLDARDAQRQRDMVILSREVYEMKGKAYTK